MSWDSNNSNSGGPWGDHSKGGGQTPWGNNGNVPDIDALIRKSQQKFKNMVPSQGWKLLGLFAAIGGFLWLATGFYSVQAGQQGVELLFGRYIKFTKPGLNYWFPAPIGQVYKPNVEETNQTNIGFVDAIGSGLNKSVRDIPEESLMLTSDQNIIDVDFIVQWRIGNAADFLFNISNPELTLKAVSESVMREVIGQAMLEDALTSERQLIEQRSQEMVQDILDRYGAGIYISDLKLQRVDPPLEVIDAFNDVQRARQDKEYQQNNAEAYYRKEVTEAKGSAARILEEAHAYAAQVIAEAHGESQRFLQIAKSWSEEPEITVRRLYLESMQAILQNTEKMIVDPAVAGNDGVVPYLPLSEIGARPQVAPKGN